MRLTVVFCIIFIILGNAGGYLGLFLGYALLNVPTLLLDAYTWMEEKYKGRDMQRIEANRTDLELGKG